MEKYLEDYFKKNNLSPEEKLLILTCDIKPSEERLNDVKKIMRSGFDSKRFIKLCCFNKTVLFVAYGFMNLFGKKIIREMKHYLKINSYFRKKQLKNMISIKKQFDKNKIPFVVLKGFPMAQMLYENYKLRKCCDVDILIKNFSKNKSKKVLKAIGFKEISEVDGWHMGFIKDKIMLEIHWPRLDWVFMPQDKFFKNSFKIKIEKVEFNGVAPDRLLPYICSHTFVEGMNLRGLYDVSLIIKKFDLDWDYICDFVIKNKVSAEIYYTLNEVKNIFNVGAPDNVMKRLRRNRKWILLFIIKKGIIPKRYAVSLLRGDNMKRFIKKIKERINNKS